MAANDELPRGLTLSSTVLGNTAFVTFPASVGITWVLTNIDATMGSNAGPVAGTFTIEATSSTVTLLEAGISNDVANTTEDWSWSGKLSGALGASLVVGFNSGSAAFLESIIAQAYPI